MTECSGSQTMRGMETCIFWNKKAASIMENTQKNIFITGCAGYGRVRMISEEIAGNHRP